MRDHTGERFGRLTVTGHTDSRTVTCRCDCGAVVTRVLRALIRSARKRRTPMCRSCAGEKAAERKGADPWCSECADLSHRRRRPVCPTCGEKYKPERIAFDGWDRQYVDPRSVG